MSIHGTLDDRSLVEIVVLMISLAKRVEETENKHYQYFLLLSGQDYPIKPLSYISKQLKESYPLPYIDCTPYDRNNWIYYKFYSNSHLRSANRWVSTHLKKGVVRYALRAMLIFSQKICSLIGLSDYKRLQRQGISLYGGSAWWILPDKIIDFILSELDEKYVEELLCSNTPEETFFQIMSMRSPLKELVHINPISQISQSCKTWAYFSDEGKPFKGHPYVFTSDMFSRLIESEFWFARKFDIQEDEDILNMLDDYLQESSVSS